MLEFTTNPRGLEGVLAELPRETLCTIDGEEVTIPVKFPAMAGLAYTATEAEHGYGAAMVWAMQVSLGSEAWLKLLTVGLTDEQLVQLAGIVVGRIQGQEKPIPQAAAPGPKARTTRPRRSPASKK